MIAQICVGSSCYLRGSEKVIELFQKAIADNNLQNDVTLAGSFCTGKCNRIGVTITIDGNIYTGVTPENFHEFFVDKVLSEIHPERG